MNKIDIKNALRQNSKAIRNEFGVDYLETASNSVCDKLSNIIEFQNADTILMYYPIKNELSPLPIFTLAQKMGKIVAFPVCSTENNTLTFKQINNLNELCKTHFGLFEPNESAEEVILTKNTLCIVPALLFSRDGYRLGYGKGYYDRFLNNFNGISVGISFSSLVCDSLPKEKHDKKLNVLITENEVIYFDKET